MKILVLNSGSSSEKSCLYELGESLPEHPQAPLWGAQIDWSSDRGPAELAARTCRGSVLKEQLSVESRASAVRRMLATLWESSVKVIEGPAVIDAVGHRVVHGGDYREAVDVTPEVKAEIARLAAFAPLHNSADLEGIEVVEHLLGAVPQTAVFDTSFHRSLSPAASVYPGPYQWLEQGIRRYGFHGISHRYCAERAAQLLNRSLESLQLITCHVGNGCSVTAIRAGQSADTTMGFTPLEGLMMGTRSGSIDPGILIHLLRQGAYTPDALNRVLNLESGLLGVSGVSSDMRKVAAAAERGHSRSKLAIDLFIHRLRSAVGAMLPSLERLDGLVFTAGIGENSPLIRAAVCNAFGFLGLKLDKDQNALRQEDRDIAARDSAVRVLVVHAEEAWAIACECWNAAMARRVTP